MDPEDESRPRVRGIGCLALAIAVGSWLVLGALGVLGWLVWHELTRR